MTDSTKLELIDITDIKASSFTWARAHSDLIPTILTDKQASVIVNGLRMLEKVIVDRMQKANGNKALYVIPLNVKKRLTNMEENLETPEPGTE